MTRQTSAARDGGGQGRKRPADSYEIPDWVDIYAQWDQLLEPERRVLERLNDRLKAMKMLDVGVGGGRTTCHFAHVVKEYVGVDVDPAMVAACLRRFPERPATVRFAQCDVRSMPMFEDETFDLVLFSFNGLDYLAHEDRLVALREVARVTRRGGYFLFSTHNLRSIGSLFSIRPSQGIVSGICRPLLLRLWNGRPRRLAAQRHARIYDGVYLGKLRWVVLSTLRGMGYYYYSHPAEQVAQVEAAGFRVVAAYGVGGNELDRDALWQSRDRWIYYLCERER
jgi:SAM-dependent methyltransferase